ncbi:MAG: 6-pyruvoyl tetrahydropterin synthase family protein [Dehalococcoidia bacterium]
MKRKVTVERNTLRFSAAHFTTFGGDCEPLHGHNYDVFVEVEGDLTPDAWVIDFVQLKRAVAALCRELDHRFLLPLENPHLTIAESDTAYQVRFADRCYVMPRSDVCPLPIDNSTAERLAEYLASRLAQALRERGAANVSAVTVAVEEAPGQAGWCTLPLDAS